LTRLADDVGAPVHLIEECDDPVGLNAAPDIAVLSSAFGEGFANVVAEAMASGVPCIATNVGDSAVIIAQTGLIVPLGDPRALAQAMSKSASDTLLRTRLGDAAYHRIEQQYGLATAVAQYKAVWAELAGTLIQNIRVTSTTTNAGLGPHPTRQHRRTQPVDVSTPSVARWPPPGERN